MRDKRGHVQQGFGEIVASLGKSLRGCQPGSGLTLTEAPSPGLCWPTIRTSSSGQPGSVASIHVLCSPCAAPGHPAAGTAPSEGQGAVGAGPGWTVRLMGGTLGGRPSRPRRGREWVRVPQNQGVWGPQVWANCRRGISTVTMEVRGQVELAGAL